MRFFTSMSSSSGFKARGRGARWHRSYSDRGPAPAQQQSPLTSGPNPRPDGPRGPRPYTGHYTPHGRGPPYSHGPSPQDFRHPSTHFFGPPAPGLGYGRQQPTQFHGHGPPYMQQYYNQQPPPQWYGPGTPPKAIHGQTYAPQQKEMLQQQFVPNKLAFYRREWRFPPSRVPPQCEKFRLLSYNILADYLAIQHSTLYSHVPAHMLSWQWRMNKLLFEFQLWSPDILCLQEVDRFPELQTELEGRGYNGIWKIRTGNAIDGCAIFWRANRFQLLHHEDIEFNQIGLKDNVAQICVLESKHSVVEKTPGNDSSSMKTSSNRVVVCNIHVLFNPNRGEIKLGQVRTLINQALAVSKSWGDASVVLCGDFNSTPNSPLYKFISEQKLDLSGLTRRQISGQQSGNALASAPGHKFPRSSSSIGTINGNGSSADQSTGTGTKDSDLAEVAQSTEKKSVTLSTESDVTQISDAIEKTHVTEPIQEANATLSTDSDAARELQELCDSNSGVISSNSNIADSATVIVKQLEETHIEKKIEPVCSDFNAIQESQESNNATTSTNYSGKSSDAIEKAHFAEPIQEANVTLSTDSDTAQELQELGESNSGVIPSNSYIADSATVIVKKLEETHIEKKIEPVCSDFNAIQESQESNNATTTSTNYSGKNTDSNDPPTENSYIGEDHDVFKGDFVNIADSTTEIVKQLEETHIEKKIEPVCSDFNASQESQESTNYSGKNSDSGETSHAETLGDDSDIFKGDCVIIHSDDEDNNPDENFLSELHGTHDEFVLEVNNPPEIIGGYSNSYPPYGYRPYEWTPHELKAATGREDCTFIEHSLKLRSVYTDVENHDGTKGSYGEPEATCYNQNFLGTVDYIWSSEGLKTARVLDTIPKHILKETRGFPTKKWGSDHIALVCELAFTNG